MRIYFLHDAGSSSASSITVARDSASNFSQMYGSVRRRHETRDTPHSFRAALPALLYCSPLRFCRCCPVFCVSVISFPSHVPSSRSSNAATPIMLSTTLLAVTWLAQMIAARPQGATAATTTSETTYSTSLSEIIISTISSAILTSTQGVIVAAGPNPYPRHGSCYSSQHDLLPCQRWRHCRPRHRPCQRFKPGRTAASYQCS